MLVWHGEYAVSLVDEGQVADRHQAIRMLLVAHTNHSRLKHAVERYLVIFGHEFGVINQLMNSLPTEKMLEAVSEAYAAFSEFLAKAVKYYKESKLTSALKAFGFPWGESKIYF